MAVMMGDVHIQKGRGIGWRRAMDAEIAVVRAEGKRVIVIDWQTQEVCAHESRVEPRGCRHKPGFRTWSCPECHKQWDEWDEEGWLVWKMVRGLGEPGDFERWREMVLARGHEETPASGEASRGGEG